MTKTEPFFQRIINASINRAGVRMPLKHTASNAGTPGAERGRRTRVDAEYKRRGAAAVPEGTEGGAAAGIIAAAVTFGEMTAPAEHSADSGWPLSCRSAYRRRGPCAAAPEQGSRRRTREILPCPAVQLA